MAAARRAACCDLKDREQRQAWLQSALVRECTNVKRKMSAAVMPQEGFVKYQLVKTAFSPHKAKTPTQHTVIGQWLPLLQLPRAAIERACVAFA